jgi:hypothetical protein
LFNRSQCILILLLFIIPIRCILLRLFITDRLLLLRREVDIVEDRHLAAGIVEDADDLR